MLCLREHFLEDLNGTLCGSLHFLLPQTRFRVVHNVETQVYWISAMTLAFSKNLVSFSGSFCDAAVLISKQMTTQRLMYFL